MSNIDNLGMYGEFTRDAGNFIKQIQDNAVDGAALKQRTEGAVVGAVIAGVVVGGGVLIKHAVVQYKSKSEERKASTATATERLKNLFKKNQNMDDEAADDEVDGFTDDGDVEK